MRNSNFHKTYSSFYNSWLACLDLLMNAIPSVPGKYHNVLSLQGLCHELKRRKAFLRQPSVDEADTRLLLTVSGLLTPQKSRWRALNGDPPCTFTSLPRVYWLRTLVCRYSNRKSVKEEVHTKTYLSLTSCPWRTDFIWRHY